MDPKSFPQNLDPKLKEAYDRVMGFAAKPTPAQPTSQTPSYPSKPDPINQPPSSSTPPSTFPDKTGAQPTVKPQPTMQYETPPAVQARPVLYQTESFSNNPVATEPQTPQPKAIPYQPITQEPQYPPVSQPISPSEITEPSPASPDSVGMQSWQQASIPQTTTEQQEKKSSLLTIVIVVLGIIFLLIYAFFWIRFFDVTLPFELPF